MVRTLVFLSSNLQLSCCYRPVLTVWQLSHATTATESSRIVPTGLVPEYGESFSNLIVAVVSFARNAAV
jgi:hypothetical protein